MSKSLFTLAAALAAVTLAPAYAASLPSIYDAYGEEDHDIAHCNAEAVPTASQLATGRIVSIDTAASRITLDYRPLPLLPEGGIRIFTVENPASLKGLSAGDRVRFEVEREGRSFVVTRLENSN